MRLVQGRPLSARPCAQVSVTVPRGGAKAQARFTLGARHPSADVLFRAPALSGDAQLCAALLAVDPAGLGGAVLAGPAGPLRDAWVSALCALLPSASPVRRLPLHANGAALLGGLDLSATLAQGTPVVQTGLLAQAHGGLLQLPMAHQLGREQVALLCSALDQGQVQLEREGITQRQAAQIGLLAFDEGLDGDAALAPALLDRLAFVLPSSAMAAPLEAPAPPVASAGAARDTSQTEPEALHFSAADVSAAAQRLPQIASPPELLHGLCATAMLLGIGSLRAPLLALRVAKAAAALAGLPEAEPAHAQLATRLVLAHRATRWPESPPANSGDGAEASGPEADSQDKAPPTAPEPSAAQTPATPPDPAQKPRPAPPAEPPANQSDTSPQANASDPSSSAEDPTATPDPAKLQALLVQAALSGMSPGLLAALKAGQAHSSRTSSTRGGEGAASNNLQRGRPTGSRRGEWRPGQRLHLLDTLRAAAPWQRLRQQAATAAATRAPHSGANAGGAHTANASPAQQALREKRIWVQKSDFHRVQFRQQRPATTLFVVDASGSQALHRLAEAKGAVELLLAECYVRRDQVALLSFRGAGVELLLPPTRSLTRAKRCLAGLPGGGGTPLAQAIDASAELAQQIARQGQSPVVVLLTDGRANIARDGSPGRAQAGADALAAAHRFARLGNTTLLVDTSAQPQAVAQALAEALGAIYLPLPYAGAQGVSHAVQLASGTRR